MRFDFSDIAMNSSGLSRKPMTFCDTEPKQLFSAVVDLIAVETGDRKARDNWQSAQIKNLIKHVHDRSPFWRKRLGTKKAGDIKLADIPILTRHDVREQVMAEGTLLSQQDGLRVKRHMTSGSSGTPVEFFVSQMNGYYNQARMIAQYFLEGRDLNLNRTRLRHFNFSEVQGFPANSSKQRLDVKLSNSWLAPLDSLIKSGLNKNIGYWHPSLDQLLTELSKHPIGYFVVSSRLLEVLFSAHDIEDLIENKIAMVVPLAGKLDEGLRKQIVEKGIPVRSNYSSEEVGLIGSECIEHPNHYHVAESNVFVEVDKSDVDFGSQSGIGRILVTHLHSYATPFVRYDIGDFGALMHTCKCGHNGLTICNIGGREKEFVSHAGGRLTAFHIRASDITQIVDLDEYGIRQTSLNNIVVEIAGCKKLSSEQRESLTTLIKNHAQGNLSVEIRLVDSIDWGRGNKRLGFCNEVILR
jgi:phenylacetate-coenzyme A ligase PaaK-like adenylate-forming protein